MTQSNAVAFIDEAGEKGLVRNLSTGRDQELGLLCSLVFPFDRIAEFQAAFAPPFERFKREGGTLLEKLHITEAFKPGNESLREMADKVRNEIFEAIRAKNVPIIYAARRMKFLREAHERLEKLKANAKAARRNTSIKMPDQPSTDRVEHDLMTGLVLRLDALSQDYGLGIIELATDQIDIPVALGIEATIDRSRSITYSKTVVKAYDLPAKKPVQGTIEISVKAPFEIDVKNIGQLKIVGKDDPFVFATDVVTNALYDHLKALGPDKPLNAPVSVNGWAVADRILGVSDNAAEDLY